MKAFRNTLRKYSALTSLPKCQATIHLNIHTTPPLLLVVIIIISESRNVVFLCNCLRLQIVYGCAEVKLQETLVKFNRLFHAT